MRSPTFNQQNFRLIFVAYSLSLIGCGPASDRVLEETVEQSYKIEPTTSISIKNVDGSIQVYGSPAHEMTLQAIKRAYSAKRLKQIAVDVSVQPGTVAIQTTFPREPTWGLRDRSGTVDYIIVVPNSTRIRNLEMTNGEIAVDGLRGGSARARLITGHMFSHNCFGNLDLAVTRGRLDISYDWWEPQTFAVEGAIENGNIKVVEQNP